ncbi:hypothetical protein C0995_003940 [Termitomyces sp. Mi166|nr:hypothetical protein C0995_003940 [Termitomyces sp. Mi166\
MVRPGTRFLLPSAFAIIHSVSSATAFTPLVDKRFSYPNGMPYKADTDVGARGGQIGYNRCDASTEGQSSLCQTSFLNSVDDFCLWGPPNENSVVGDVEGEMVAWCTKPGRGTRVIPPGAITGVQFTKTPDYVQVVGFIDQTKINIAAGDSGGEMDPHGADLRGNPLGGLVYSTAYTSNKNKYVQVIEWHNFMGSNTFCFKACDPSRPNAAKYCQHIYDRIGCEYNAPSNARDGVFESCKGDNQDFPGVYTDAQGKVHTYTQPPESLGDITSMPYVARVPASSECVQYQSAALFSGSVNPGSGGSPSGGVSATTTTTTTATASLSSSAVTQTDDTSSRASTSNNLSIPSVTSTVISPTRTATGSSSTITDPPSITTARVPSSAALGGSPQTTNAAQSSAGGISPFVLGLYAVLGVWVL